MKKNIFLRIGAVVMVTALCTACILSSTTTLAKYASYASGTATGTIAKWEVKVNNYDFSAAGTSAIPSTAFDLFDSIVDTVDGAVDTHVGNGGQLIAPGTKGTFELTLENNSDVTALFTIELTTSPAMPSTFDLSNGPFTSGTTATVTLGPNSSQAYTGTSAINWKWIYEDGNGTALGTGTGVGATTGWAVDTPIGINSGGTDLTATLNVYAVQVD